MMTLVGLAITVAFAYSAAVVFDKTGTLTEGRFGVTDVRTFDGVSEDDLIRLAAAVEQHSEHPLAAGVLHEEKSAEIKRLQADEPEHRRRRPQCTVAEAGLTPPAIPGPGAMPWRRAKHPSGKDRPRQPARPALPGTKGSV